MNKVNTLGKKILIICPFAGPNLGGVETHIDKLINYAVRKGLYVVLLTYQPLTRGVLGEKFEEGEGFEIHRVSWFGVGLFTKVEKYFPLVFLYLFPGLFVKSLLYYIKNHKSISCIHAHGLVAAAITRILTSIYRARCVVSTHAVYSFSKRGILRFLVKHIFNGFDVILAVSDVSRKEIMEMGFAEKRVKVHPNWVDTDVFNIEDRDTCIKSLSFDKSFNVLFVGRFLEKKGVQLLLDAALKLPNVGFHFVGDGPLKPQVLALSESSSNVNYYGVLMQSDLTQRGRLIKLYNACHLLVSPYLYDEGFSATLIESVACGTQVVVPKRGSPPTFLSDKVAIFLSYSPTVDELVEVLTNEVRSFKVNRTEIRDFAVKKFGFKNADVIIESYR